MTKLQRIIAVAAAFVLMVGLSACNVPDKSAEQISEFTVTLQDGTEVPCIKVHGYDGVECNFDKAVRSNAPTP